MQNKEGKIAIRKGVHEIVIVFFENGGGADLQIQLAAPDKGLKRFVCAKASVGCAGGTVLRMPKMCGFSCQDQRPWF